MQPVKEYTFDNFIIGKSNRFAFMASKAVADKPGESYNPLFIYGESGLGKTHLLNAIYNHIQALTPNKTVYKVSSDEIIEKYVNAISAAKYDPWQDVVRSTDILLIDNANLLLEKEATQTAFAFLIRACVENYRQIVMASTAAPDKLPVLESSIRKNCQMGLFADIQPLDNDTAGLIVLDRAARQGLWLSEESMEYIVSHAHGEVRRLEGVITRLHAEKELMESNIDFATVKKACDDYNQALPYEEDAK